MWAAAAAFYQSGILVWNAKQSCVFRWYSGSTIQIGFRWHIKELSLLPDRASTEFSPSTPSLGQNFGLTCGFVDKQQAPYGGLSLPSGLLSGDADMRLRDSEGVKRCGRGGRL